MVWATENGDVLRFKGAILARQETNRNNDEITEAGIDELAATIGGRPIDVEHRTSDNCGVFTAGRAVNVDGHKALSVDGLVWADRYPDTAAGMQGGAQHLSIEAVADKAKCSACGQEFLTAKDYCEHLTNRRRNGTRRTLQGLRAKGGAVTKNPAGTNTKFDPRSIYFVASHEEANDLEASWYDKYLKDGESINDLPSSDFADPEGRRFPYKIHGDVKEEGFRAAWSAAHGGHTGTVDESAIAKLKRDKPSGVDIEAEDATMKKKCPDCGQEVAEEDMAAHAETHKMKGELDAALVQLASLTTERDAAKAERDGIQANLVAEQKANANLKASIRRSKLGESLTDDEWEKQKGVVMGMDDAAFDLMASKIVTPAKTTDRKPVLAAGDPSDNGQRVTLR